MKPGIRKLALTVAATALLLLQAAAQAQGDAELRAASGRMAQALAEKYPGYSRAKVAIMQFRTTDNRLTRFNEYLQDELARAWRGSKRIEVIDQNTMNDLARSFGWTPDKARSYAYNDGFSRFVFEQIGLIPNAIVYGLVADNGDAVTLTAYLLPDGDKSANIQAVERVAASEQTDRLLGKPARPRAAAVLAIDDKAVEQPGFESFRATAGGYDFQLTSARLQGEKVNVTLAITNPQQDGYIYAISSRFFDTDGNEYTSAPSQNTLRDRNLLSGVPMKGTIGFGGAGIGKVSAIRALEITVKSSYNDLIGVVRFDNVPLTKE